MDHGIVEDYEPEHPSRLSINHQLGLGRLHGRQVRRLRAPEDATGVDVFAGGHLGALAVASCPHLLPERPAGHRRGQERILRPNVVK
jgi:hypothetical protein